MAETVVVVTGYSTMHMYTAEPAAETRQLDNARLLVLMIEHYHCLYGSTSCCISQWPK